MEHKDIRIARWNPQKSGEYRKEVKLDVVYGPINSRRLGLSLGVNPIQRGFACNWGCVYCQYGAEALEESIKNKKIRVSTPAEVKEGLERRLTSTEHYDSITLCGPTEPTLNPYFNEIAGLIVEMRDRYRPQTSASLFTNATKLRDKNLEPFDYVFMKLDAGNPETFEKFNRPNGTKFEELIETLKYTPVKKRIIQTAVVGGKDGNLNEDNIKDYEEIIREIKPDEIHLYPLLYQPFPEFELRPINRDELNNLAERIRNSTQSNVLTFINPVNIGGEFRF